MMLSEAAPHTTLVTCRIWHKKLGGELHFISLNFLMRSLLHERATQLPSRARKSPPRPYSNDGWCTCLEQLVHLFVHYRSDTMKFEQLMNSLNYCDGQCIFPPSNKAFRRYANSRVQNHKTYPSTAITPIEESSFRSFFEPNTFIDQLFIRKNQGIDMAKSSKSSRNRSNSDNSVDASFYNDAATNIHDDDDPRSRTTMVVRPLVKPSVKQLFESARVDENPFGLMVVIGSGQANDLADANLKWITITYHAWAPSDAEKVEMELYGPNKDGETSILRFTYPTVSNALVIDFKRIV